MILGLRIHSWTNFQFLTFHCNNKPDEKVHKSEWDVRKNWSAEKSLDKAQAKAALRLCILLSRAISAGIKAQT